MRESVKIENDRRKLERYMKHLKKKRDSAKTDKERIDYETMIEKIINAKDKDKGIAKNFRQS